MTAIKVVVEKVFLAFVVMAFALAFVAPKAQAATYYYNQGDSNAASIEALVKQINALLAQLQRTQASNSNGMYHKYYFNDGTPKKKTYTSASYDIEVRTKDANVDSDDMVELVGEVELDDAPYADVWFEYGTDSDLDEETDSDRVTDDETFEIEIDDVDEDDQYYFRAVAQDPRGYRVYGRIMGFEVDDNGENNDNDDDNDNDADTPDATTDDAEDVDENSAELHGDIDMNDYENGIAFFVYGEDEDAVEDVEDESEFDDVEQDGDDLKEILLSSNLDDDRNFSVNISNLDEDTDHFFRICVEYDDEDDDQTLVCGEVEEFTTDN